MRIINVICGTLCERHSMEVPSSTTVRSCVESCGLSINDKRLSWTMDGLLIHNEDWDLKLEDCIGENASSVLISGIENKINIDPLEEFLKSNPGSTELDFFDDWYDEEDDEDDYDWPQF